MIEMNFTIVPTNHHEKENSIFLTIRTAAFFKPRKLFMQEKKQ